MSDQPQTAQTSDAADDAQAQQMLADAVAGDQPPPAPAEPGDAGDAGEATPGTGKDAEVDWQAEADKWRKLARKHEDRAKQNAEAARKWAEFEQSQLTEQERLQKRLEEAERELAEERRVRARLAAASEHRLPMDLLELLAADDEDGIAQAAKTLNEAINAEVTRRLPELVEAEVAKRLAAAKPDTPAPPAAPRSRPVEALIPGAMPAAREPVDGNAFLRRLAGRDV